MAAEPGQFGDILIWSHRQLATLARSSATSLRTIEDLVTRQPVSIGDKTVWGQFLDQSHVENQYGIYGTSSAIQILALSGYGPDSTIVRSASAALRSVLEDDGGLFPPVDLENSFKVAYLLEAFEPHAKEVPNLEPLESRLVADIAGSDGWGYHRHDSTPRVLPTAHLLLALRRSLAFRNSPTAIRVVSWLGRRIQDDESLGPVPNALASLALASTLTTDAPAERLRKAALDTVIRRLDPTTHEPVALDNINEHYSFIEVGTTRQLYMFYLKSSVVARAVLAQPEQRDKSYATRVVAAVCKNIQQNGGFRSPSTGRIGSVDQLEIFRLLEAFADAYASTPADLLPQFARAVSSSGPRRALTGATLTAIGGSTGYLTFAADSSALQTAGLIGSAVSLGVLAAAIWAWTGGKP